MLDVIEDGIELAIDGLGSVFSGFFSVGTGGALDGAFAAIVPVIGLGVGFYVITRGIGYLKNLVQGY